MFPSKAFSMSDLKIYPILKLNYYKKLLEWWTKEVNGDCISFNLYRNTESSIVLLKNSEEITKKKNTVRFINNVFI